MLAICSLGKLQLWLRQMSHCFYTRYVIGNLGQENMKEMLSEIEEELSIAIKQTIVALKKDYPSDHFYYFALTTGEEALSPGHSIWSEELLEQEAKRQAEESQRDYRALKEDLRFSYADSPLFYKYEKYFKKVESLFRELPNIYDLNDADYDKEFKLRIGTMIQALKKADTAGVFGVDEERQKWFINVEVNPPDGLNLSHAKIFNDDVKIKEWVDWGGE